MSECHVAVVGAGPYGLAVAAHLRAAGLETRIFGKAMETWQCHMPAGMLLHTPWCANHIADPQSVLTLDRFVGEEGMEAVDPLSLAEFVKYGLWYQQQLVPDLDERRVTRIERASCGFRITLEDGAPIQTQRVVIATGYCFFARRPPQFDHLPQTVASHTFDHNDLGKFAGQRVLVVGGGQSGFGSAALLDAAGAQVEVVLRKRRLSWLEESKGTKQVSLVKRCYRHIAHLRAIRPLLFPRTGVGPPPMSWITNLPGLLRHLPHASRHWINNWIDQRIIDRGSSWWPGRLGNIPITTGRAVRSTVAHRNSLCVTLDDGTTREVDHMLLATGYVVDITRYPFFPLTLTRALGSIDGYPELGSGFESSVAGLHFVGLVAQGTFGPMMNSIGGTQYAARTVTHYILRNSRGHKIRHG